ncbi:hypothetical protein PVAP13_4NG046098 [Panicum virgatum]|uniref:Uncharacterized protein n=1 Tax=Panicum virgatum TaxID=38727 RepID=A0A8T0TBQ8_PANVG|nr:hypothetical protein PVAP13_4NG046098 [Panicum virgatum]
MSVHELIHSFMSSIHFSISISTTKNSLRGTHLSVVRRGGAIRRSSHGSASSECGPSDRKAFNPVRPSPPSSSLPSARPRPRLCPHRRCQTAERRRRPTTTSSPPRLICLLRRSPHPDVGCLAALQGRGHPLRRSPARVVNPPSRPRRCSPTHRSAASHAARPSSTPSRASTSPPRSGSSLPLAPPRRPPPPDPRPLALHRTTAAAALPSMENCPLGSSSSSPRGGGSYFAVSSSSSTAADCTEILCQSASSHGTRLNAARTSIPNLPPS